MKKYNVNDRVKVEIRPEGEVALLKYYARYKSFDVYLLESLYGYDSKTHTWTGQLHEFMRIFGGCPAVIPSAYHPSIELLDDFDEQEGGE